MKVRSGHLFKRNGIYHVQWRVNGKLFTRTTKKRNKKDAQGERDRIMAPFIAGDEATVLQHVAAAIEGRQADIQRYEDDKTPPLTIDDTWDAYIATPNRPDSGDSTLRQYRLQFGRFVKWLANSHKEIKALRGITPAIASEFASHLQSRGLSPNTFNKYMNLLQLVFRVLKDRAQMTDNPWDAIQRKRLTGRGRRELTIEELKTVCGATKGELRLLFSLGIYSGLRLGDCATLRWSEVDLQRSIILRIPNKVARRKNQPVHVPIHPVLHGMISAIPKSRRKEYVLPKTAKAYDHHSDLVTRPIQKHFEKCGIRTHKPGTGMIEVEGKDGKMVKRHSGKRAVVEVGFHSLRHTFVSLCREANAPLAVVEAIVGHANPAMTRHYTHVGDAAATSAVAALPSLGFIDTPETAALPATTNATVPADKVRELAQKLTPETLMSVKDALLALCG